jgi:hypothetical protein
VVQQIRLKRVIHPLSIKKTTGREGIPSAARPSSIEDPELSTPLLSAGAAFREYDMGATEGGEFEFSND